MTATLEQPRVDGPTARLSMIVAIVASMLFVTFLVVSTSRAAFSATTDNSANSVAAGTVVLTDDDTGAALFTATGLAPLDATANCIEVTYDGTVPTGSPVVLYSPAAPGGTGLAPYLDMTIEVGAGGPFGDCSTFVPTSTMYTGTLAGFAATHTGWASGASTAWSPTGAGQTTSYRVTLTLQDDAAAQGLTADFDLVWEAQS